MAVLAAKNYSMVKCDRCDGQGQGCTGMGSLANRWYCENCDGSGKVSKFPPARNVWAGFSTFYERQAGA